MYFYLRRERGARVFEIKVVKRMFRPNGKEEQEDGENFTAKSCIIVFLHRLLL
jgi:hypothetical protein